MGVVKKVFNKVTKAVTGIDLDAKRKAQEAEEEARRQAEEQAALQAKLAAEQAAVAQGAGLAGQDGADTVDATQAASTKKKKLASGRKNLSVARSGGAGINV